ncbi:unnamed protein product [Clavelina lepadiformis]|uniref:Ion transport domain-containing protein n=1 Tax=Clavelina lepadiformis TaxID=159417 RepID=A0ABP0GKR7_CLALP
MGDNKTTDPGDNSGANISQEEVIIPTKKPSLSKSRTELSKAGKLIKQATSIIGNSKPGKSLRKKSIASDTFSSSKESIIASIQSDPTRETIKPLLSPIAEQNASEDNGEDDKTSENTSGGDADNDDISACKKTENSPISENFQASSALQSREKLLKKLSGRLSASSSSAFTARETNATSSMTSASSHGSVATTSTSSYPTVSGPSRTTRSDSTVQNHPPPIFRRTSTQQTLPVGDANSRLLKMALSREWSQMELALRYMAKSDPGLFVVDDETGMNPLMLAARDNRIGVVERLIEMGVNVNDRARDGQAAIHFAVGNGREEIVNMLVKKRADLNLKGGEKENLPLHVASSRSGNNSVSIAQTVLRATNKSKRLEPNRDGNIPLFLAIEANNQSAYKDLLSSNAEDQLRYQHPNTGSTALHMVCGKRDAEMVRHLCKKGALVNIQNKEGVTALHIAATMGDLLIVECLLSHNASPELFDKQQRTPLHAAAEKGHTTVVELIAERFPESVMRRTQDGSTLMHIASECGHPDTTIAFLKKGVPLHMPNKSGAVCLHSAAKNNHVEVVRTLLMKGARVDARTKDELTPLHVAVKHCRPMVVQMLLGFGAPVQIKGGAKQETPLHLAAQVPNGEQVAEMLIKSGANANSAREDGETAVHMASRKGNLNTLKLLLDEDGDCRTKSKAGENALHIAVRHCMGEIVSHMIKFLEKKYSRYEATMCINMENKEGETPVHLAAELTKSRAHSENEEVKIISILLDYGGDINICTKLTQETPLHYCAREGNNDALQTFLDHVGAHHEKMPSIINRQAKNGWSPLLFASDEGNEKCVDVLLQHSARADVFDENGKAALHLAAENGHDGIADRLIRKNAFINAKTKLGHTPLHLAAQRGYNNLVKLLLKPIGSDQKASIEALSLDKKTPLHKASEDGKIDVCKTLLDAGADAEAVDNDGQTPLHLAAENDHSNVVKMFLVHRRDLVTTANRNGATCAHIAASKGSASVIKELLKSNRDSVITARNLTSNATALHLAASKGHAQAVRELILNGASLIDEDSEGMNALHLSAKNGHTNIIEVVIQNKGAIQSVNGISLNDLLKKVSSKTGFNVLHVATQSGNEDFAREMLRRIVATEPSQLPGIKIDAAKDTLLDHCFTPLHLASQSGHVNLVRMILNQPGVSVEACTKKQRLTPLHLAAKSGYVAVVGLLLSKSINQLECVDERGCTCLHYAAACGHVDMASLLLGQGANIESHDKSEQTPLHLASKSGSLKMVKLLTEAGAPTTAETKEERKIPLQFAAAARHYNIVSYLLKKEHDTYKLIEDKTFVCDLMLVAKSPVSRRKTRSKDSSSFSNPSTGPEAIQANNMDILEEFILSASAPIDAAAKLSRAFCLSSNREKEQATPLLDCANYCETLAVDLLEICSASNGADDILKANDNKSNPFLDVLIECEQKNVIAHPAVQTYLSNIWLGKLNLSDWNLFVLFFAILILPFIWLYLALPINSLHRIPIIKFMVYLVSHLYMMTIFIITVAIPITPISVQADLIPQWNEWLLLAWMSGVLVNEITSPGKRTGLARIRIVILILFAIAILVHLIALAFPFSENPFDTTNNTRLEIIYIRNLFLSAAMTCAFVQLLEFLSFHYLFGPWSIIIEGLLNDLIKFGVILLLFIVAFTMWLAAVYQPVYADVSNATSIVAGGDGSAGAKTLNPLDTFQILFFALFGLIEPDNLPPINRNPLVTIYFVQIVFGLYHVITLIVLINLLIAMMSDTYQRIQAQSDTEWKFGRAKLIRNMKKTSLSPAPVNLFVTAFHYAKLLAKHKGRACDVGIYHMDDDETVTPYKHTPVISNNHIGVYPSQASGATTPDVHVDNMARNYHPELGNRRNNLQNVVDWNKIRQKYLMRKGKQKSTNDAFLLFRRDSDLNVQSQEDERRLRTSNVGSSDRNGLLSPASHPNEVPEIT